MFDSVQTAFSDGLNHTGHEQRKNHDYPSTSD
nr:MAG TPA: hypothetical protein [Caudoviricetes sp.]